VKRKKKGTVDVAISGNRNLIKKEAKKILNYKDHTVEKCGLLNVKKQK
jgi:hypothetical protein